MRALTLKRSGVANLLFWGGIIIHSIK